MLASGRFAVRTMSAEDVRRIAKPWMEELGWNPGHSDWRGYHAADPRGFFVGELDGAPIATVSAVRWSPKYAFMGTYIVRPEHRKGGFGLATHLHARRHVEGCLQGGDAVLENVAMYAAHGRIPAYRITRWAGVAPPAAPAPTAALVPVASVPRAALVALDSACVPVPRGDWLVDTWLTTPDARALALPCPVDGVRGFGMIRPAHASWRVGPLFARDASSAATLLDGLVTTLPPGTPYCIDVPDVNPDAVALVASRGLQQAFACMRTFRGPEPPTRTRDYVFGATSIEIG